MTEFTAGEPRTRTTSWYDPHIGAAAAGRMSGLEYLRAMQRGDLPPPPAVSLLDLALEEVREGVAVFAMIPSEFHYNPIGVVHGGVLSTICDSAMGCAVHSTLPAGTRYTTLELKVNFIRPLTLDVGRVICEGRTIHVGGRTATAEARVVDEAGKLYAHAVSTCLILRPPG